MSHTHPDAMNKVLVSFLHHLTIVRNHCAHHGRIWNRRLTVKMRLPSKKPAVLSRVFNRDENMHGRLYNTLAMLAYLLQIISPESHWQNKLTELLGTCPQASAEMMGFTEIWEMLPLWEDALGVFRAIQNTRAQVSPGWAR